MNAQENKQLVQEGYQEFLRGDIASMLMRCHDDAEWINPDSDTIPFAGAFHGKQGIAEFFTKLNANLQAIRFEPQAFVAEDDKVVVVGQATWQVKMNGRQFDTPWMHVFTMRDGKVASVQALTDTAATERAFRAEQPAQPSMGTSLHH